MSLAPMRAHDDPRELVEDLLRHPVLTVPEDPAHADELADPHQAPGEHLRVALGDLARLHRLAQPGDVALRQPLVVRHERLRRDELGLADDPVERRMLGGEAEEGAEAEQLALGARLPSLGRPRSSRGGRAS